MLVATRTTDSLTNLTKEKAALRSEPTSGRVFVQGESLTESKLHADTPRLQLAKLPDNAETPGSLHECEQHQQTLNHLSDTSNTMIIYNLRLSS